MKNQTSYPNVIVTTATHHSPHVPEKLSEQAFYLIALALALKSHIQKGDSHTDLNSSCQIN